MDDTEYAEFQAVLERGNTSGLDSLSPEERIVCLVAELNTSMQMEGIEGYFSSHRGALAPDVASALEIIGAAGSAGIIREACKVFSSGRPPADWEERRRELSLLDAYTYEHLSDLSDAYLAYPDDLPTKFEEYFRSVASPKCA